MKKLLAFIFTLAAGVPSLALATNHAAATGPRIESASGVISSINTLVNQAIPVLVTFAVLYIIYAVVRYMIAGDEEKKAASKIMVGYGIVGLFIILSIWGLVNILVGTFNLNNNAPTNKLPGAVDRNGTIQQPR